jgi:hypothetical protein
MRILSRRDARAVKPLIIRQCGAISIRRSSIRDGYWVKEEAVATLSNGEHVAFFPEGRNSTCTRINYLSGAISRRRGFKRDRATDFDSMASCRRIEPRRRLYRRHYAGGFDRTDAVGQKLLIRSGISRDPLLR